MIEHSMATNQANILDLSNSYLTSRSLNNVSLSDVTIISPDDVKLIDKLSFSQSGGVLAIIGDEGVGKTTLLRAMAGELQEGFRLSGSIQVTNPVYCSQFIDSIWNETDTFEYLFKQAPNDEFDTECWNRYSEVASLFAKMNLDVDVFFAESKTVGELSGGESKKLQLAKAILHKTSVLLLDEPTNHLDLHTIIWFENFIKEFEGTVIIVSHDEQFLENVSTSILFLQRRKGAEPLYRLSGNGYKKFIEEFESEAEKTQKEADKFDKQQKKLKREVAEARSKSESRYRKANPQDAAEKGRVRRGMAKATQNITQRSELILDQSDRPEVIELDTGIRFPLLDECVMPNGKNVLSFQLESLCVGDRQLSKNISLQITGPERVVIIGQNGAGKTTLMNQILEFTKGLSTDSSLRFGYVPQKYYEKLTGEQSAEDFLMGKGFSENAVKAVLARLHFVSSSMSMPIKQLSGGQLCKILIANILLSKPNVLLLDEPTNNLYPLSNRGFRQFLCSYPGAEIIISHDRKLISEVASKVLELTENGLVDVTGRYRPSR